VTRITWRQNALGGIYAYNRSGTELGFLENIKVGRRYRWVFEGERDIFFTIDCLREIADKIDALEAP